MHYDNPSNELIDIPERAPQSSIEVEPSLIGRLHYWWSLFMAALLLLIYGPPVLIASWLANRPDWVYPWAHWGASQWLKLSGMKVVTRGLERLDPKQAYVFICNHHSYLDTATLFCYAGRPVGILAKKELFKVPILKQGMPHVNVAPIDRSNKERAIQTIRAATDRLRSGLSFGVFAEGTRARPGELLPFKKGGFYMAIEGGVPIVPVAIKNTDVLMGKGTGNAQSGTIEMVMLEPVPTEGLEKERDVDRLIRTVRGRIAEELGGGK